jgi:hypothetical protein
VVEMRRRARRFVEVSLELLLPEHRRDCRHTHARTAERVDDGVAMKPRSLRAGSVEVRDPDLHGVVDEPLEGDAEERR